LSVGIWKHAPDAGQHILGKLNSVAGAGWPAVDGESHLTVGLLASDIVRANLFGLACGWRVGFLFLVKVSFVRK
jgi:hypothetical protein